MTALQRESTARALRPAGGVDGSGHILSLVRTGSARTTTEIAASIGAARSTVSQRLGYLAEAGLVADQSPQAGLRGRPATSFRFNPDAGVVLAAQVGISGSRFAITDLAGEVLEQNLRASDVPAGPERLLSDIRTAFDDLLVTAGRSRDDVIGIGIGIPSSIELASYASSLGHAGTAWDRDYFRAELWADFDAPVFVDLDVNLLALAERQKSWPLSEVFVCIKLGTLINASIVVNGAPVHGASGLAGELGHVRVSGSDAPCTCGSVGCLDAVASGRALVAQLKAAGFDVEHVSDVVALAAQNVPEAVSAIRDAGRRIGEVLASVVNLLNPDVIVAWGYLADAREPLFAGIREGMYENALPGPSDHLHVDTTSLGELAGVRGAAMMVTGQVLSPDAVDRMITARSWSAAWSAHRPPALSATG